MKELINGIGVFLSGLFFVIFSYMIYLTIIFFVIGVPIMMIRDILK